MNKLWMSLWVGVLSLLPIRAVVGQSNGANPCPVATDAAPPYITVDPEIETFSPMLAPQVTTYLNVVGGVADLEDELENAFPLMREYGMTADVVVADITGDGRADVLVSATLNFGGGFRNALLLYECQGGQYALVFAREFRDFSLGFRELDYDGGIMRPYELVDVVDVNHDGRLEVIFVETTGSQKLEQAVIIDTWDGTAFVQIHYSIYLGGVSPQVTNLDADPELELVIGRYWGYGQAIASAVIEISEWRSLEEVYDWTPTGYRYQCAYFPDPSISSNNESSIPTGSYFETLNFAEAFRACGMYAAATPLYTALVYDDLTTFDSLFAMPYWYDVLTYEEAAALVNRLEISYMRAFGYYRLIQLHLHAGEVTEAQALYDEMATQYTIGDYGTNYLLMARAYLATYTTTTNSLIACQSAAEALTYAEQTYLDPGIPYYRNPLDDSGAYWTFPFYWYSGFAYGVDPDNVFNVPPDIGDVISVPMCLSEADQAILDAVTVDE